MDSDCIMYYHKLDEYPLAKYLVLAHELDHHRASRWNFPYHVWIDYRDTPFLLSFPEIVSIVKDKEDKNSILGQILEFFIYQLLIIPLQIYSSIRILL